MSLDVKSKGDGWWGDWGTLHYSPLLRAGVPDSLCLTPLLHLSRRNSFFSFWWNHDLTGGICRWKAGIEPGWCTIDMHHPWQNRGRVRSVLCVAYLQLTWMFSLNVGLASFSCWHGLGSRICPSCVLALPPTRGICRWKAGIEPGWCTIDMHHPWQNRGRVRSVLCVAYLQLTTAISLSIEGHDNPRDLTGNQLTILSHNEDRSRSVQGAWLFFCASTLWKMLLFSSYPLFWVLRIEQFQPMREKPIKWVK